MVFVPFVTSSLFMKKDVFDNQVMQEEEIFHSVPTLDELNQDREMCKKKTTEEI